MTGREAWGLDIGQTALHAVKIRRTKGQDAEIADAFFFDLNTDLEDPKYDQKVHKGLKAFAESKRPGKTPVVIALAGFTTLFREFNLPAASASRLDEIVSYEAKQLIPYPLEEVIYDYHRLRVDMDTGEIAIALVCCKRDIIAQTLESLDSVGLNVEAIQVGPVALVNYVIHEMQPEDTVLVLDTGARGTDFIVLNDRSFWLRSIGISGSDLSKALMNKFNLPFDRAESLKLEMGDSRQADRVFKVMVPVLGNLCAEVQRSIGYYKSLFRGVNIREVVCAGNTYLLAGVDQYVADTLGLATRTLDVPETISVHFGMNPAVIEEQRQIIGTAAGLGLQGVGLASVETNLLPRDRLMRKFVAAKFKWAAASVAAIFLAVLVNILWAGGQAEGFQGLVEKAKSAAVQSGKREQEYKDFPKKFASETSKSEALATIEPTRGMLLSASAAAMLPVEEWNAGLNAKTETGAGDPAADIKIQESDRLLQQARANFKDMDFKDGKQLKNLEDQIARQVDWQYNRLRRIFCKNISCKVVKCLKKVSVKDPSKVEWIPVDDPKPGDRNRDEVKTRRDSGFTYEAEFVVQVELEGFMVTTGDRMMENEDNIQFQLFHKDYQKLPGILPGTFVKIDRLKGEKNQILVPRIIEPRPREEDDAEGAGGQPAMSFDAAQEAVATFKYKFMYLPAGEAAKP